MINLFRRKPRATTYVVPRPPANPVGETIKRAPRVARNGHKTTVIAKGREGAAKSTKGRAAKSEDFTTGKQDKELAEWMAYLFGDQVRLERNTEIPGELIIPFAGMKLQNRLPELRGEPSDVDLAEEFMRDLMEMFISLDREGRREMREVISAGIRKQLEDEPEALL